METGAPLRALKPASLLTGGLSHTPLRERSFFRGRAPEKRAEFPRIRLDLDRMRICFAPEGAKFCEAGLAARWAALAVGRLRELDAFELPPYIPAAVEDSHDVDGSAGFHGHIEHEVILYGKLPQAHASPGLFIEEAEPLRHLAELGYFADDKPREPPGGDGLG